MDISSAFGNLDEIREAIRAMKPFESEINAISNGGVVYQIHYKRAEEHPDCPECLSKSLPGGEAFSIEAAPTHELLTWDVAWAIAVVGDGRASYVLPKALTGLLLESNSTPAARHLDHVDPSIPGIITVVPQVIAGPHYLPVLIDGSHRAARCLRDGLPFRAWFLTGEESLLSMESASRKLLATVRLMRKHGL